LWIELLKVCGKNRRDRVEEFPLQDGLMLKSSVTMVDNRAESRMATL